MEWWIDGAFAVHDDMKSHSGAYMSLGKGALIGGSTKQKLNTKSSTEAELVAVDDYMAQAIALEEGGSSGWAPPEVEAGLEEIKTILGW